MGYYFGLIVAVDAAYKAEMDLGDKGRLVPSEYQR
jgi:hypothetical protein